MKKDFIKVPVKLYSAMEFFDLVKNSFHGIEAWRIFNALPSLVTEEQLSDKWKYPPEMTLYTVEKLENGKFMVNWNYEPVNFSVSENDFITPCPYGLTDAKEFLKYAGKDTFVVLDKIFR